MNRRVLEADNPLRVGETILIPVAEVLSFSEVWGEGAAFACLKRAKAVVAIGPRGAFALDLVGQSVSLEELADEVSGLKELVAGVRSSGVGNKE
ncbi:hypothetical protein [Methanocrinis sp.]|uniref:hypothetical protein n=1 Tax=Methanocrinis sp. TaxID=3101522 RepID=UPI003D135057